MHGAWNLLAAVVVPAPPAGFFVDGPGRLFSSPGFAGLVSLCALILSVIGILYTARSNRASHASAAAAIAGTQVTFELDPWNHRHLGHGSRITPSSVSVRCTGATVFVHGAELIEVGEHQHYSEEAGYLIYKRGLTEDGPEPLSPSDGFEPRRGCGPPIRDWGISRISSPEVQKIARDTEELLRGLVSAVMRCRARDAVKPRRLPDGEHVTFTLPTRPRINADTTAIWVRVRYSLDGKGRGFPRLVKWIDERYR